MKAIYLTITMAFVILANYGYASAKYHNEFTPSLYSSENSLRWSTNRRPAPVKSQNNKPSRRILLAGKPEDTTLPVLAVMYAPDDSSNSRQLKAVCAGVIIEADLILTSRECLRDDLDDIRFDMVKKTADKQSNDYQYMLKVEKVHEWSLANDELGSTIRYRGDLIVYELKEKMRLDENTIYSALVPIDSDDPAGKASMDDFEECKLYAYGGNERLYSVNLTAETSNDCHGRQGLSDLRECARLSTDTYNLCLADRGSPIICKTGLQYKPKYQMTYVYGILTDLHYYGQSKGQLSLAPSENLNCQDPRPVDGKKLVSISKVSQYSQWLIDLSYDSVEDDTKKIIIVKTESDLVPITTERPFRRAGKILKKGRRNSKSTKKSGYLDSLINLDNHHYME